MKNIYLSILAVAFFSAASAQSGFSGKPNSDPENYVDVNFDGNFNSLDGDYVKSDDGIMQNASNGRILFGHHIFWLFNDVGNHNSNRLNLHGAEIQQVDRLAVKKLTGRD